MNTDLISKLIRLANNNPNENEANLAARKVCKMLTDFKFNSIDPTNSSNSFSSIIDIINTMSRATTETQRNNSGNPFTQERYYSGIDWDHPPDWEGFHKQKSNRTPWDNIPKAEPTRTEPNINQNQKKPYPDSYDIKCTKCGKVVNVKHSRSPESFKCRTCAWIEEMA